MKPPIPPVVDALGRALDADGLRGGVASDHPPIAGDLLELRQCRLELNHGWPPAQVPHTGVTCGAASGLAAATQ